jgi:DNA-binding MarR family transcriptional regulator
VADALHSAAIHLLRGVRKEDAGTGVGPARLSALSVLVFAGPMRLTELALIEQVKPPTMTKVVAGLEAAGLVRRGGDVADARAVRLEATPRGTKLLQEGRRRRVKRLADALQAVTFDELEVLARAAAIVERVSATISHRERVHPSSGRTPDGRL